MEISIQKPRLKGNGGFYLRDGWLRKGITSIEKNPTIFSSEEATDILGVGSNMVSSIKYYLLATNLTYEKKINNKFNQYLTEDFGKIIVENDPYFEDIFSLWLLHYNLVKNISISTSWGLFFNFVDRDTFDKDYAKYKMEQALVKISKDASYSQKSLLDDIDNIIKSYVQADLKNNTPEENLICIFSELGLLKQTININGERLISKVKPSNEKIDPLLVLYILADNIGENNSISIKSVLENTNNLGKVLFFDRPTLNYYLDILKSKGYIEVNRAAGLDQIYLKLTNTSEIIRKYYSEEVNRNA